MKWNWKCLAKFHMHFSNIQLQIYEDRYRRLFTVTLFVTAKSGTTQMFLSRKLVKEAIAYLWSEYCDAVIKGDKGATPISRYDGVGDGKLLISTENNWKRSIQLKLISVKLQRTTGTAWRWRVEISEWGNLTEVSPTSWKLLSSSWHQRSLALRKKLRALVEGGH